MPLTSRATSCTAANLMDRYTSKVSRATNATTEDRMRVPVTTHIMLYPGLPSLNPRLENTMPATRTMMDVMRKVLSCGGMGWSGWQG